MWCELCSRGPEGSRLPSEPSVLASDAHVFEAVVREAVDEEAVDVVTPGAGGTQVCYEDQRRVVEEGALDGVVFGFARGRILLQVGLRDLVAEVRVVIARPVGK